MSFVLLFVQAYDNMLLTCVLSSLQSADAVAPSQTAICGCNCAVTLLLNKKLQAVWLFFSVEAAAASPNAAEQNWPPPLRCLLAAPFLRRLRALAAVRTTMATPVAIVVLRVDVVESLHSV